MPSARTPAAAAAFCPSARRSNRRPCRKHSSSAICSTCFWRWPPSSSRSVRSRSSSRAVPGGERDPRTVVFDEAHRIRRHHPQRRLIPRRHPTHGSKSGANQLSLGRTRYRNAEALRCQHSRTGAACRRRQRRDHRHCVGPGRAARARDISCFAAGGRPASSTCELRCTPCLSGYWHADSLLSGVRCGA